MNSAKTALREVERLIAWCDEMIHLVPPEWFDVVVSAHDRLVEAHSLLKLAGKDLDAYQDWEDSQKVV